MGRLSVNHLVRIASSAALAAALLTGCTGPNENRLGRVLVAPGGFDFYDCTQLAAQEKSYIARDKELLRLMAKAKQGPAGGFVSAVTYEPDYASNEASLRELRRAQAEKNCAPATPARRSDTVVR